MKPADKAFLDGLRKSVCVDIAQDHWNLVCKAVDDAGDIRDVTGYARTIILEGVEKAKFGSRSEAGRYAANMRWKGQGRKAELAAKYPGVDMVVDLPPPGGKRSAEETARIAANVKRLREEGTLDAETSKKIKSGNLEILANMIRRDLKAQGKDVPFGAKPYLDAMSRMNDVNEMYGADDGKSIVAYALSNLASYKGETARAIKAELKARMQGKAAEKPEQESTGFDSPKMKEQLAYEAKRDDALGAKAADIADAVSERDEPATPKAGTPGPTFDSRSGFKGPKYQGYRKVTVVAQDVRRDLKDAVANGELPQGLKFSVKSDSRGTNAVRVRVAGLPKTRDDYGRLTGEAKAVYDKVDSIVNAYNRDNSDIMTDYFDVDYYGTVQLDD